MRLSKQFWALAEFEHLTLRERPSYGVFTVLVFNHERTSDEARCGLHLAAIGHFALGAVLAESTGHATGYRIDFHKCAGRGGVSFPSGWLLGSSGKGLEANLRWKPDISGFVGPSGQGTR